VRGSACCLLTASLACSFDPSGGGAGGGSADGGRTFDAGGRGDGGAAAGYRKLITVAALGGGDLVDFPLYVQLDDADLMAHARNDGIDVHFTSAGGDPLDHEVERWDPGSGRLEAWVRVTLAGGAATTVALVYGEPEPPPAPDPADVWASGFAAVWHLEESPAGPLTDALGVRPGTASGGMDDASSVTGTVGRAIAFDGADDMMAFDNPLAGAGAHTFSAWVNQEATDDNDALLVVGTGACGEARWLHTRFDQDTVAVGLYCDDWADPGVNVQDAGWKLVHWTYADGESRLYIDGAAAALPFTHDGAANTQGSDGFLGNVPGSAGFGANMGLNGTVDEVRIATRVRSPGWIAAEFANQSSPATFYSVGSEQPL
jgi:hypothetical protein